MNTSNHTTGPISKRERLIHAASRSYHQRGVLQSTLKVIADEAGVPLGNVYYYFPSKDDLALAVIEQTANCLTEAFRAFEVHADPRERIAAYLDACAGQAECAAQYGCPVVTLASELHKTGSPAAAAAARVVGVYQGWLEQQLQALPVGEPALMAEELFAGVQGAYAVSSSKRDPASFTRLLTRLRERVRQLPAPVPA